MQPLLALSRLIDQITAAVGKFVMWLILLSVLVSAGNAIVRKVAPQMASNAWLELQWYLFGAAFMGAAAYTLQQNEHIRVDVLYASRSRRTQHWIDLLGHLLFLAPFAGLMAWLLWDYTMQAYRSGQISTNAGGLLIWPARAILLAGFILLCCQTVAEVIKKIAVMRGLIDDPHPFHSAEEHAQQEVAEVAAAIDSGAAAPSQSDIKRGAGK